MVEVINPGTEEVIERIDSATAKDTNAAVERAREAFPGWRDVEPGDRARLLRRLAEALDSERETLVRLESQNVGKPLGGARGEIGLVVETFAYYAGAPEGLLGDTIPVSGGVNMTFREDGVISINSNTSVRVTTPFGGMKQSGVGRELGPHALDYYTEVKNVYLATEDA